MTKNTDPAHDKVEAAKAAAMEIRYDDGIPIRVFSRKGMVIWSEVDDQMRDLTDENSEGRLYHVRSVFVPHGAQNPLTALRNQPSVDDVRELLSIKAMLDALLCERWATAWQTDVVRRLKAARDRLAALSKQPDTDSGVTASAPMTAQDKADADNERGKGPVNCNHILRAQGKVYPRTCDRCKLGPCPFYQNDISGDRKAVLEEAAKVADDHVFSSPDDDHQLGQTNAAQSIAQAIRALATTTQPDTNSGLAMKVPEGQTPLDANLGHRYLAVFNEGVKAREDGTGSPYHGHSLEHCLHAAGWIQRDLRLALDEAKAALATTTQGDER